MTIVGVELCEANTVQLLVLDPDKQSSLSIAKRLGCHSPQRFLKSFLGHYQYDKSILDQYDELETLV